MVLILLFLLFPRPLLAYPVDLDKLPNQGRNSYGCLVCHINPAGGEVTSFGRDYMNNDYRYDKRLRAKDSDGDGYPNHQELSAHPPANPGDPHSFPFQPPNSWAWVGTLVAALVILAGGSLYAIRNAKPCP